MKAFPLKMTTNADGSQCFDPCVPSEATHVMLHTVGPFPNRKIPVQIGGTRRGTGNWSWNGDTEKPTLRPSIKTWLPRGDKPDIVCHSWVNDGVMRFLSDCTHEHAGKDVELLDVEW